MLPSADGLLQHKKGQKAIDSFPSFHVYCFLMLLPAALKCNIANTFSAMHIIHTDFPAVMDNKST